MDSILVSLPGTLLGLLAGPPKAREHSTDVVRVIVDAELSFNQLGHPLTGPQVCRVARSQRSAEQQFLQLPSLSLSELWPGARMVNRRQSRETLRLEGLLPSIDARARHVKPARYLSRPNAILEHLYGEAAPFLKHLRTTGCSHAETLA